MRLPILLAAIASGTFSTSAAVPVPTPAQAAAIEDAQRRGRDLYDFDQAAWVSTDALRTQMPDPATAGIRGWIVEREPGGTVATYYGLRDGKGYKLFAAHMHGQVVTATHVFGAADDSAMTPIEQRMIAARSIATSKEGLAKAKVVRCEESAFNSVVLVPATATDPVSVYVLTPQITTDRYPFGGHYRIDVEPDGAILNARPFAKSCIAMAPQASGGGAPAGMFITHLLDAQPTEIHVWISLVAKLPVYVMTASSREIWRTDKGSIRLEQNIPEGGQ